MKRRWIYVGLSAVTFIICCLIVKFFSGYPLIRGFSGDILVILVIYFFLKTFRDFRPTGLTVFIALFAMATEILQYFDVIGFFGLEHNHLAKLVIGAVFDLWDLVAYGIGAVIVYFIDTDLIKRIDYN